MKPEFQIFQTKTATRWHRFLWFLRFAFVASIIGISIVLLSVYLKSSAQLPRLISNEEKLKSLINPESPIHIANQHAKDFHLTKKELLQETKKTERKHAHPDLKKQVRAGFYVNWDVQSYFSLRSNISKMNMVLPEWFFIGDKDTVIVNIDERAMKFLREYPNVKVVPMISNFFNGGWNGKNVERIIASAELRTKFIQSVLRNLKKYKLNGVNIDFEAMEGETVTGDLIDFQVELYETLHAEGFLVTQDIAPFNTDYDLKDLQKYNDYLFVMAYDEHFAQSKAGTVAGHKWVEKVIEDIVKQVPEEKIVLCIAGYGYDWGEKSVGNSITFQRAIAVAKENKAQIKYDNTHYNLHYDYIDADKKKHQVFFCDAGSNFNAMRSASDYGLSGVALWRLGSEDPRLWEFFNWDMSLEDLQKRNIDTQKLDHIPENNHFDFIGEGEVLDIVTSFKKGKIDVEIEPKEILISEQKYQELPTNYVIRKYAKGNKQVVLSFDDGPDERYTPAILDILKKEKVPAVFFVVGINAEHNLPLLRRIYDEGFEIGNHTFTHPNLAEVSESRALLELNATRRLIECVIGRTTLLFRPPYNADSQPETMDEIKPIEISKKDNYYTIGESIDPLDWQKGITAKQILDRIKAQEDNGSIILLHDAGGDRSETVKALPQIIKYYKEKGYEFTTVAKLMGKTKDEVMPRVKQGSEYYLAYANWLVAFTIYEIEYYLFAFFFLAIILSFGKVLLLALLVLKEKIMMLYKKPISQNNSQNYTPKSVSIIVPAYNEEVNIVRSLENLLMSDYPNFEILFVDDGSKDNTLQIVQNHFANNPKITILTKINGGKASALNFGIAQTKGEILVCIDADTQLKNDAVSELLKCFEDEKIGAVAGNVRVGNEVNLLTNWQSIEYITSQNFDRRAFAQVNAITVIPGAIGAFKKEALVLSGGFTTDTLAEDCDLTLRILRQGYQVTYNNHAIAMTESPETLKMFIKQRFRWGFGILQCLWKHKTAFFGMKNKGLSWFALPCMLIFQFILPLFAPIADALMLSSLFFAFSGMGEVSTILTHYVAFILIDFCIALLAFTYEHAHYSKLWLLIPQRFIYRFLMYFVLMKVFLRAVKGELVGWGILKRTGNVKVQTSKI